METRFRSLFLTFLLSAFGLNSNTLLAAESEQNDDSVLIEPEIKRSEFDEALIDTEDFEIILALGYLSIEDFGVNPLYSVKLNYNVNEDIFIQITLGQSEGGETSFELLSAGAPLLTDGERELNYYTINIGYNLLPGEAFVGEQTAFNTAFYISAGIGNTDFAGDDHFSINYGAGYRVLLSDAFSASVDFRNNVFDMDLFGNKKITNNLEFTIGIGWFF